MALQKTVTTTHGLSASNAYHRVENVSLQGKNVIKFDLCSYASSSSESPFDVSDYGCSYDIDGSNPIQQAYEYLKTLSEFSGATDV